MKGNRAYRGMSGYFDGFIACSFRMNKNQKRDHALYYIEKPDRGFSPERNKQTIERSIKRYEARRLKELKDKRELFMERADAVVTYLKFVDKGGSNRLDKFFTSQELNHLNGENLRAKIMEGIRMVQAKNRLN